MKGKYWALISQALCFMNINLILTTILWGSYLLCCFYKWASWSSERFCPCRKQFAPVVNVRTRIWTCIWLNRHLNGSPQKSHKNYQCALMFHFTAAIVSAWWRDSEVQLPPSFLPHSWFLLCFPTPDWKGICWWNSPLNSELKGSRERVYAPMPDLFYRLNMHTGTSFYVWFSLLFISD